MEELIPALKQKANEELQCVTKGLKESGKFEDDNDGDYDDLIAKLVERAMEKIKVNIHGQSTQVATNKLATGEKLNDRIKKGAIIASEKARNSLKVEHFLIKLTVAKKM